MTDGSYWRANLRLVGLCLAIWFVVSFGFGILLLDLLDRVEIGGFRLGFWFAQQGSIGIFIVASSVGMYVQFGTPQALDPANTAPRTTPPSGNQGAPDLMASIGNLRQRLETNPDDVDGWILLGRSYGSIGDFASARLAYTRAQQLAPGNLEPRGIHLMLSPAHAEVLDEYLADLGEALSEVKSRGETAADTRARYA